MKNKQKRKQRGIVKKLYAICPCDKVYLDCKDDENNYFTFFLKPGETFSIVGETKESYRIRFRGIKILVPKEVFEKISVDDNQIMAVSDYAIAEDYFFSYGVLDPGEQNFALIVREDNKVYSSKVKQKIIVNWGKDVSIIYAENNKTYLYQAMYLDGKNYELVFVEGYEMVKESMKIVIVTPYKREQIIVNIAQCERLCLLARGAMYDILVTNVKVSKRVIESIVFVPKRIRERKDYPINLF